MWVPETTLRVNEIQREKEGEKAREREMESGKYFSSGARTNEWSRWKSNHRIRGGKKKKEKKRTE